MFLVTLINYKEMQYGFAKARLHTYTHTHIGISGSKWNRGAKVGSVDYFNRKGDFSWYLGQMTQKVC